MDQGTAAAVSFDGVGVTFPGGTAALAGVDLLVRPGEFVSIVGPSGCGKSTLLRVAAGLQEPTAGTCTVDHDRIGFVFQDANLLPWRTVQRNAELPAELHGMPRAERARAAQEALALVGLADFAGHTPAQLSGGMRMRASLARALVLSPDVFLFDEPFGALDEMTREHLNDEIRDLYVRRRFTGLFVTHSVSEAVYMSTRVVVLSPRPGRVVADIPVALPVHRTHELRYTAEFGRACAEVSTVLRGAR